jgi:type II secretory pathway pseudopilin PulG
MKNGKHSQEGFFLTALTAVLSIIAFIFVLGYSSYYSKRASLTLEQSQQEYLYDAKARMLEAYTAKALQVDSDLTYEAYHLSPGTPDPGKVWLAMAGIPEKWSVSVGVSNRLTKDGVKYTSVTLWLPTETDSTNAPSYDPATGTFQSCSTPPCAVRGSTTFDGYGIQLDARNKSYAVLNSAAVKAQSYFKARYLTDVVRDISTNHFRAPRGSCGTVTSDEMPCIDNFTPLGATSVPALIGLDSLVLTNAWGLDVEVTNLGGGSSTTLAPYTMAFRTQDPWGGPPLVIYAVQPL